MFTVSNQKGTAITETALMIALIVLSALASIGFVGKNFNKSFQITGHSMSNDEPGGISGNTNPNRNRPLP